MDDKAIIDRKRERGTILTLLESCYPESGAYQTLLHMIRSDSLAASIKYLQGKGYIEVSVPEEPNLHPLESSIITLSAHGVDLLEGSIAEDPGIVI